MRCLWMTAVQKNRHAVSERRIKRDCRLKKLLLHIPRKFGPKPKCSTTQKPLEFSDSLVHFISFPFPKDERDLAAFVKSV